MKFYNSLNSIPKIKNPIVTIGTFDGLHVGHQKILSKLKKSCSVLDGESVVLTFDPHPRKVLYPDNDELRLINTQEEKIDILKSSEIDHLIVCPFTIEFSRMTSVDFVKEVLVKKIGIRKLIIGYDHHFGRNREGGIEELKELSELYDFEIEEVSAKVIENVNVSSTKIRNALAEGRVNIVSEYLGYSYPLSGKVIEGDKIGASIGFPTANIGEIDVNKVIPGNGVYAVQVKVTGVWFKGMMNIGTRPTIGDSEKRIEVNIFDFDEQIYDQEIKVNFIRKLRDEMKFDDLEKLKSQLFLDKNMSLELL
ncbi:MAG: bifunctional riboflavin kinase/FAD synthetase [Flavobacteriales bacterium]|nr:bifunctional riboflavin kinase/FAD synthetase [Flavobacteriales bacterium]